MTLRRLFKISRPRFWLYEAGTFGIGYIAGITTLAGLTDLRAIAWFLFFLIPANLLIYGINDIYDYETDKLNPKKVAYEALVEPKERKPIFLSIAILVALFLPLFFQLEIKAAISLLVFFFFAIFYSAPPIRAKGRPVLDSLFSAGHYIATGVFGFFLSGQDYISWIPIIGGVLWAMAMHAFSAVPDIQADKDANTATIATKIGAAKTIILCIALYIAAAVLLSSAIGAIAYVFLIVYLVIMFFAYKAKTPDKLFSIYRIFPVVNVVIPMVWTILYLLKTFS